MRMRRRLGLIMVGCLLLEGGQAWSDQSRPTEFLYQVAKEHLRANEKAEAMEALRKALLLDPTYAPAQQTLHRLEQEERATRDQVMEETLARLSQAQPATSSRDETMAQAIQQAQRSVVPPTSSKRPEPQVRSPKTGSPIQETVGTPEGTRRHEPLSERLNLPTVIPHGLEPVIRSPQQTRREVLVDQKRAGFQKLYKEGIGFEPIRGLGFSGRTEIFAEPIPIESYIIDSKVLNFSEISQFRRSILPLFTRSGAGRVTLDYEPFPRLSYEYDARETLHQFQTKFNFKDIDLQTHAVNALYSFPEMPIFGVLTVNPFYKRVLQSSDHDLGAYEHRDEMIVNLDLQQTDNIDYFFQLDMYQAHKTRTVGASKLKLFKGQLRLRFPQWRLFLIPSYEYSVTDFDPSDDQFIKRDIFVDWGFDITNRLRASSKQQVISAQLSQPDKIPSNPTAEVFNGTNTLSYELFKDFDVSLGFDWSKSFGYSNFNNVGIRAEVQLFKAGLIRSKLGYEWVSYYNISDDLSMLYWKFFLFQ